jgi:hypothetical protein
MSARGEVTDVMIGAAVMGVRVGGESVRVALACGRLATRVPVLGGPLRTAVGRVAADGERTRAEGLRRIDAEVDRTVTALLEHPRTRALAEAAVANPALRQMILDAVDSTLTVDVTDRVLDRRCSTRSSTSRPALSCGARSPSRARAWPSRRSRPSGSAA